MSRHPDPPSRQRRLDIRDGYDLWSRSYDRTPNALVHLDNRFTTRVLDPQPGERILDAGCGTGRHIAALEAAGSEVVGLDFAHAMLRTARRKHPRARLARADLNRRLPVRRESCDGTLCALVGEHMSDPREFFRHSREALRPGGRIVFTVYHPARVHAGSEARFRVGDTEYRIQAHRHTVDDYLNFLDDARFDVTSHQEHYGDHELARAVPGGERYLGWPMLLILRGRRRGSSPPRACARSRCRSDRCSSPTEIRIRPSVTPRASF